MKRQEINGQTLIEVMVTVLFIAAAVIALIRFQNYLSYDSMLTRQKSDASLLAANTIETLKNFQVLNNLSGYTSYQSISSSNATSTVNNTTYTVTWTTTNFTNPTYKNINVVVTWTDRNSNAQSLQLSTNIAGADPGNSASIM